MIFVNTNLGISLISQSSQIEKKKKKTLKYTKEFSQNISSDTKDPKDTLKYFVIFI